MCLEYAVPTMVQAGEIIVYLNRVIEARFEKEADTANREIKDNGRAIQKLAALEGRMAAEKRIIADFFELCDSVLPKGE